jgi:hypothetical protein
VYASRTFAVGFAASVTLSSASELVVRLRPSGVGEIRHEHGSLSRWLL